MIFNWANLSYTDILGTIFSSWLFWLQCYNNFYNYSVFSHTFQPFAGVCCCNTLGSVSDFIEFQAELLFTPQVQVILLFMLIGIFSYQLMAQSAGATEYTDYNLYRGLRLPQ